MRIGGVVMAAGSGSRFGRNKLEALFGGKTLLRRALEAVPTEHLSAVAVVTQYDGAAALAEEFGFRVIRNDRPEEGLSRTVRLGTEALWDCDAIMFQVADQPLLHRETVAALLAFYREAPDSIAALSDGARRGNPCVFPRRFFPALAALEGDEGGSAVIRRHVSELRLLEVDGAELRDVDTVEALARLTSEQRI